MTAVSGFCFLQPTVAKIDPCFRGYRCRKLVGRERNGCVAVDERLAELLQLLMDKYTFKGVENSWLKLCYYYDYLGANS